MIIRQVKQTDLEAVYQIEIANFSQAEAASYEAMQARISKISDTFLVAEIKGQVVGYIEGPVVLSRYLTDDLFETVIENAKTGGYIAVTSLSVALNFQKQGIGRQLIEALKDLAIQQNRFGINLTCHDYLIPYYEKRGFLNEGQSQSNHGGAVWYDMVWDISKKSVKID